jgi:hypothetical protein
MAKKKKTMITPEERARFEETQRLLAQRLAYLEARRKERRGSAGGPQPQA